MYYTSYAKWTLAASMLVVHPYILCLTFFWLWLLLMVKVLCIGYNIYFQHLQLSSSSYCFTVRNKIQNYFVLVSCVLGTFLFLFIDQKSFRGLQCKMCPIFIFMVMEVISKKTYHSLKTKVEHILFSSK